MDRVSFLIAISTNQVKYVVSQIDQLEYWDAKENGAPSFQDEIRWTCDNGDVIRFYCIPVSRERLLTGKASERPDGTWDLFQIMPKITHHPDGSVGRDWAMGTKFYRLLSRYALDEKSNGFFAGPWMAVDLEVDHPVAAASILKEQVPDQVDSKTGEIVSWKVKEGAVLRFPISVSGIDPKEMAAVSYKPSLADIVSDKEILLKNILPKLAPVEEVVVEPKEIIKGG